jgi:hypothetical protein
MTKPDGTVFEFKQSPGGLYFLDTNHKETVLINTVADTKTSYTNQDYLKAMKARQLQIMISRPSTKHFIKIVTSNQLPNCPVTGADILAAEHILGLDVGSLKGKTVWHRPHLAKPVIELLPPQIMSCYCRVTLAADVMYANGVPMMVTVSRNIRFATVEALPNSNIKTLVNVIKNMVTVYRRASFIVTTTLMDGKFEPIQGDLVDMSPGITLNKTANDEHVGDIERFIRTLKEQMRVIYNTLPFNHMPSRINIKMAKHSVFWLNSFPHQNGVSADLSPSTIITSQAIDFNRHCKYEFGEYVQTHEQHDNSMAPCTIGALAMHPTGNVQGNYYFFSLSTGWIINRMHATKLPMPDDVIKRVHGIACRQKANLGLMFLDCNQAPDVADDDADTNDDDSEYVPDEGDEYSISDADNDDSDYDSDDDDSDYLPVPDGPSAADTDDFEYASDTGSNNDDKGTTGVDDTKIAETKIAEDGGTPGVDTTETPGVDAKDGGTPGVDTTGTPGVDAKESEEAENSQAALERDMEGKYGPRSERYNMHKRRECYYSHLFVSSDAAINAGNGEEPAESAEEPLATPQMSMKKGLKIFGEAGVQAVEKEMLQLHERKVMEPKHAVELSPEQKREALAYLMFLKRNRCGKIKVRGCADGRKQRAYTAREDAGSPTVATESLFLTMVINALEGRDVAILDVPGAFMQADMDELVHVCFTGKMVDLLMEINQNMYGPCIVKEGKETVMYVELLKALYSTAVQATRLFGRKSLEPP